jgi:cytochrome c553
LLRFLAVAFLYISCVWPALGQTQEKLLSTCLACHQSQQPETPHLGGQPSFFLVAQLFLFREGRRDNVVMTAMAKNLTNDDLRDLSEAIAKLPPPPPPQGKPDAARLARAEKVAAARHCARCHNPDYSGHDNVPRLAHQREDYLLKALRDYRSGRRIGYGNAAMAETVAGLADEDLAALAQMLAYWKR